MLSYSLAYNFFIIFFDVGLVIQELTSKGDEELLAQVHQSMTELVPRVREAAVTFKKSNQSSQE